MGWRMKNQTNFSDDLASSDAAMPIVIVMRVDGVDGPVEVEVLHLESKRHCQTVHAALNYIEGIIAVQPGDLPPQGGREWH